MDALDGLPNSKKWGIAALAAILVSIFTHGESGAGFDRILGYAMALYIPFQLVFLAGAYYAIESITNPSEVVAAREAEEARRQVEQEEAVQRDIEKATEIVGKRQQDAPPKKKISVLQVFVLSAFVGLGIGLVFVIVGLLEAGMAIGVIV